jgi:hypothetical protein
MSSAHQAINEMRPMITDFLKLLGLAENEGDLVAAAEPFSAWVEEQEITKEDFGFLASRVAAFICEYFIQKSGARVDEVDNTVQLSIPLGEDVSQSVDPYFFAALVAQKQLTLKQALDAHVS